MSKINTLFKLLKTPGKMVLPLADKGLFNWMSDEAYLKMVYKGLSGKKLHLDNPKLFTEKLQWLKLHDRKQQYIQMVDKVLVKEYVANIIGSEYIIPTYGAWESFDDIDFDSLPDQFVLKCNHDSGSIIKCENKHEFNIDEARKKITRHIQKDSYYWGREWPYRYVKRKILAEAYMQNKEGGQPDLTDYKFYCFNGLPVFCQVITGRSQKETIDFYDMEWNHQPFVGLQAYDNAQVIENSETEIKKPEGYEKMAEMATAISTDTAFCRVDFYDIDGLIYFGEITFFPFAGFGYFVPDEWDEKLGDLLCLH